MSCSKGNSFVSIVILACAFLLGCSGSAFSQTADEYFDLGKADLANNSLSAAHTNFQLSLSLDPNHEGANLFYALTSILMISNSPELNSLLDRAGVSATGRNIFAWDADFARDAYGNIVLPPDTPTGEDLQTFAQDSLLPVIVEAIKCLGKVGSSFQTHVNWAYQTGEGSPAGPNTFATHTDYWYTNQWVGYKLVVGGSEYDILSNTNNVLTLSGNLGVPNGTYAYKLVAPIEIDYGDALVFRGGLNSAKAALLIFSAFDVNVDIDTIVSMIDTAGFAINTHVLQTYPQLLTLLPTNQMAEAKANVRESITLLTAAVNFILIEGDSQGNDFFILNAQEGAEFLAGLAEWNNALDGPVLINSLNTQVDLTRFFDYPKNLRDYLPRFGGTLIKRGSFPDPTLGGIFPAMTATELYRLLEELDVLAPIDATDFDGDGRSDLTVWRPSSGIWYTLSSDIPGNYTSTRWGLPSDLVVPSDYNGDGYEDHAVWRPATGVWYVLPSWEWGTYRAIRWGVSSDIPVRGDYDGDGSDDIAIWRPENGIWYVQPSGSPGTYAATQWGSIGDIPVPADYDGDDKTDIAVWRPASGTWYLLASDSPGTYTRVQWGIPSDIPTPGDYDADGKTDMAVWRPNTGAWFILPSATPGTYTETPWGWPSDTPITGDYDGDGRTDVAVWRSSNGIWYILPSGSPGTYTETRWGMTGDEAISRLTGILRLIQ